MLALHTLLPMHQLTVANKFKIPLFCNYAGDNRRFFLSGIHDKHRISHDYETKYKVLSAGVNL